MNISALRATFGVIVALALLSLAPSSSAQQNAAPLQQAPGLSQPAQAPAPSAAPSAAAPAASDPTATPADGGSRPLKSTTVALRELSPWSMFLSADVLVKAGMIGLAFASLVTWTIFIAQMIELAVAQRKLTSALDEIADSRSLAAAPLPVGAKTRRLSA